MPRRFAPERGASEKEVRAAGLFGDSGVFLGTLGGSCLRHDASEYVMAFAPPRGGKGIGLVVPALLSWTGSAVIHDKRRHSVCQGRKFDPDAHG
jgi:type IV secretion system protein VirD4